MFVQSLFLKICYKGSKPFHYGKFSVFNFGEKSNYSFCFPVPVTRKMPETPVLQTLLVKMLHKMRIFKEIENFIS